MASVDVKAGPPAAWALGQPWCWALTGLAAAGLACLWAQLMKDSASALRFLLVAMGLLTTAAAIWLRLQSATATLDAQPAARRHKALLCLIVFDASLAAGVTLLLLARLMD